jgi:hypothetical protein
MGSKFSKAERRPHVKAAASLTARFGDEQTAEPRQELQLPDDLNGEHKHSPINDTLVGVDVAASSTTHDNPLAPAYVPHCDTMDTEAQPRHSADSRSESVSRTLQELPGDILDYSLPEHLQPVPPEEPYSPIHCLTCGEAFAKGEEDTALYPCSRCHNSYCAECIKGMFVDACADMSRMPPKCCVQIPLHHARPHLTQEEAMLFRSKYEEWSTPNPFYCPVARCSAFIPERLLPQKNTGRKGKQRVDSGVGTPTSAVIACPSCETDICTTCRNLAHANATCDPLEFGIDKETAELLRMWGYKRCPKCGNGLKRMFGCNHMECRCGAHFCWVCLKNQETGCQGGCEDDYDEECSNDEPDEEEQQDPPPLEDTGDSSEDPTVTHATDDVQKAEESVTPQPTAHVRNLDGGPAHYWESQSYDFGAEPTDLYADRSWDCDHTFLTAKVSLIESLRRTPATTSMECMKCWVPIHPEICMPMSVNSGGARMVTSHERGASARGRGRGRGRRGGARTHLHPLRDSIRGQPDMAWPSSVPDFTSHSQPTNSVQFNPFSAAAPASCEQVVDTYGNTITTTETPATPRRSSVDVAMLDGDLRIDKEPEWLIRGGDSAKAHNDPTTSQTSPVPFHKHTPISFATSSTPFSFAYQCNTCELLVCTTCKDKLMAALEDEREEDDVNEDMTT